MEVVAAEASRLGLSLSEGQLELLQLHYDEMVSWNERVNLTSITAPIAAQVRHFVDSLTIAAALQQSGIDPRLTATVKALDIGTGGGFPGLPLKVLYPELRLTLLDSVGKKTAFVQHMADLYAERGLTGINVLTGRAEDFAHQPEYREHFGLVLSRAVAETRVLAEYSLPFLRVGGVLAAPKKGEGVVAELAKARNAIRLLGGGKTEVIELSLPLLGEGDELTGEREERQVVLIHKQSTTRPQYPRQAGTPSRRPLS